MAMTSSHESQKYNGGNLGEAFFIGAEYNKDCREQRQAVGGVGKQDEPYL